MFICDILLSVISSQGFEPALTHLALHTGLPAISSLMLCEVSIELQWNAVCATTNAVQVGDDATGAELFAELRGSKYVLHNTADAHAYTYSRN